MLFDAHTRIWNNPALISPEIGETLRKSGLGVGSMDIGASAHERAIEGMGATAVLGFASSLLRTSIPNEVIADAARRNPSKCMGVAGIDPMCGDALETLERARAMGLYGISISPSAQGFHPAHSEAMRLYERCEEWGWPVFTIRPFPPTKSCVLEFDRPTAWDEVARTFGKLRIIIGELGHPWVDEALVLCAKHQHVYAELSGVVSRPWQLYGSLLQAQSLNVLDKLAFGSGFPLASPAKALENLYSVNSYSLGTQLHSIPRTALRAIAERDIPAIVGLPTPLGGGLLPSAVRSAPPVRWTTTR
ncbi:MAG: hypothetical protein EXS00_01960 [Phycisphaerales bacterium]|nr:hypothetical protein [Phycisphaerales bacterium]